MGKIRISGGVPLCGEVRVGGSKNAALPIIFATLVTHGVSVIENVPDISDVDDCIRIIEAFGAVVKRDADKLTVDTRRLSYRTPPIDAVCRIRASTYLIGACLARFDFAELMPYGGCNFSARPIDLHLQLAELFGATRVKNTLLCTGLRPANAVLSKISVGATVNALLLAAATCGVSRITPYAKEPHIFSLIEFLRTAGANIEADGKTVTVYGGRLSGGKSRIVGDMVEAGTYLAAGLVSGGEVKVIGIPPTHLCSFLSPLSSSGVLVRSDDESVTASGLPYRKMHIRTGPYPDFPTDLQPITAPIMALGEGGGICDTVWAERFGYLSSLSCFGLRSHVECGEAKIKKSAFTPAQVTAPDLRGGAACILAALSAPGVSLVKNSEIIYRGYERLTEKLTALGAEISDVR